MSSIRAVTLTLNDVSAAAARLAHVLGGSVTSDFGTFAEVQLGTGIPLWLNAPDEGEAVSAGILLHLETEDVDASFAAAISRGALSAREPQDMDFGERSAWVRIDGVPGVTIDYAAPATPRG